jgi:hypothetical protein
VPWPFADRVERHIIDGLGKFPGKWSMLLMWWIVQGLLIWIGTSIFSWQTFSVDGPGGFPLGLQRLGKLLEQPVRQDVALSSLILAVSIATLQLIIMLPVRRPEIREGGRSLILTLILAAAMIAALLVAAGFAVNSLFEILLRQRMDYLIARWSTIIGAAIAWAAASYALWVWVRHARRPAHTTVAILMERLFKGTVIEIVAILPIDYMVRRKTDCYCGEGTFWSLIVAGVVGTIAFGPMVWLPLIAKRRKEWYGGHCRVCGYDMTATPQAERCPECGTGWGMVGE